MGFQPTQPVTFGKSFDLSKSQHPDLMGIFICNGLSDASNIAGLQPTLGITMLWTGETEEQTKQDLDVINYLLKLLSAFNIINI